MFWNRKHAAHSRRSAKPRRRRGFEQFEPRRMMAVTTALSSGSLTVTGDAAGDDIAIVGTANPGEFTVTGRNGTTVNGTPDGSVTIPGVRFGMLVDLGDGQNVLNVDNVYLASSLLVTTGAADDSITLGASGVVSTLGDMAIVMGAGNDVLREENYNVLINGDHVVNTGDGADAVTAVGASTNAGYYIGLGTGDNSFLGNGITATALFQILAGPLPQQSPGPAGNSIAVFSSAAYQFLLGVGEAGTHHIYIDAIYAQFGSVIRTAEVNPFAVSVTMSRSLGGPLLVVGGSSDDRISLIGNLFPVEIGTGDGTDTVDLQYNVLPQYLRVHLGNGNDTLTPTGNWAPEPSFVSFDGGPGGNRLELNSNLFPQFSTINFA